jgi:hypothetical protein
MSFGIQVDEFTLTAGESKTFLFPNPFLYTGTMRIDNSQNIPPDSVLNVTNINYQDAQPVQITLNPQRYGWFFDNKPVERIDIKNMSSSVSMKIYFQYMVKNYVVPYSETNEFITTLIPVPATVSNQLYAGSNKRYKGSLSGATFFSSMPVGTQVAVRQVSASSTSSSALAQLTLPWAGNFESNYNIEPLNAINDTEIRIFSSDLVTNDLPASATTTNVSASATHLVVDYLFDFNMQVSFGSYSFSGTNIVWSGQVLVYYFTTPADFITGASVNSITTTGTWTESPSSGTTNSSGLVPFTLTQALTSTVSLSGTVTADTTISGITKSSSASVPTSQFDFTITGSADETFSDIFSNSASYVYQSAGAPTVNVTSNTIGDLVYIWTDGTPTSSGYTITNRATNLYYFITTATGTITINSNGNVLAATVINKANLSSTIFTQAAQYFSTSGPQYVTTTAALVITAGENSAGIIGTTPKLSPDNSSETNLTSAAVSATSTYSGYIVSLDTFINKNTSSQDVGYTGDPNNVTSGVDFFNFRCAFKFNITASNSVVIPNAAVTFTLSGGGTLSSTTGTTDSSGNVTVYVDTPSSTTAVTCSSTLANISHSHQVSF